MVGLLGLRGCARVYTRSVVLVSILGIVSANASAFSERVVCMGDDGHVSVEDAVGGFCSDSPSNAASRTSPAVLANAGSSHCGPCKDLPILADESALFGARESLHKLFGVAAVVASSRPYGEFAATCQAAVGLDGFLWKIPPIVLRSVSLQI